MEKNIKEINENIVLAKITDEDVLFIALELVFALGGGLSELSHKNKNIKEK